MSAKKKTFNEWLDSIPHGKYTDTLEDIMADAKINKVQLRNYRNGLTYVPPLVQDVINRIAGEELEYKTNPKKYREGCEL